MNLKAGFKNSDFGPIPADWSTSTVGAEFSIQLGKMLDAERNKGVYKPYLGNKAVQWDRIDVSDVQSMPMTRADLEKYRLQKGDLLVCEGGDVGRAAIWDAPVEECYYQKALHRLRPIHGYDPKFFVAVLQLWSNRGLLANFVTQTSIAHLPKEKFVEVPIPRPTSDEQREIVSVLSDMGALIAGLEKLIAKKRDLKQAAMQQLLTGQTRLPGFSGEWTASDLGDITHIKTGSRNNEDKKADGAYPFFVRSETIEHIDTYSHDCEAILVPGEGQIGSIFHYVNGRFDVHQRVYAITRFAEGVSGRYVHLYMSHHFGDWAMQNTVKATVDSLRLPTFQSFQVKLPPTFNEQLAIAKVLTGMGADLSALDARLGKTRALKQGMMQELLTGRTRLVEPVKQSALPNQQATSESKANIYFMRSVLAAEIVDQLHEEPTFGHVKFEKILFLTEHLCQVDTGSTYLRKAAGPYDSQALRSIDSQLRKQQWFDAHKEGGRYRYAPLNKRGGHKQYFERYFAQIREPFSNIIDTFRSMDSEQCEIVATLYAAWNDLLRDQGHASDQAIVHEVLHNWHESKQRIPEDRWLKALGWMRNKGFVPPQT